jgi:hypothetical protein
MTTETTGLAKEAYDAGWRYIKSHPKAWAEFRKAHKGWANAGEHIQLAWVAAAKRVQQITRRETLKAIKAAGRIRE